MKNLVTILKMPKEKIKKIPWLLASHAFSIILLLIVLSLVLGVWVFYNYVTLAKVKTSRTVEKNTEFQYNTYEQIMATWQAREKTVQESGKTYSNPFTTP